jgi:hypothetical protein
MRRALALMLLAVAPAYGQSNLVPTARTSPAVSAPASSAVPQSPSDAAGALIQGANQVQERARDAVNAGMDARTVLGKKPDARLRGFMDKADKWGDGVGTVVDGAEIYREYGMDGMRVFGVVEGTQFLVDKSVDIYAPQLAPAWRLGRQGGELIRQIKIGDQSIQGHVTDLWFNSLHGRWANEEFERNTSDEAIEQHRQKLRAQRAAQFLTLSRSNEQAAENRAAAAAQQASQSNDAAAANEMMLMLTNITAQQYRPPQVQAPARSSIPSAASSAPPVRCLEGQVFEYVNGVATPCPGRSGSSYNASGSRMPSSTPASGRSFGSPTTPPATCSGNACRNTEQGPGY